MQDKSVHLEQSLRTSQHRDGAEHHHHHHHKSHHHRRDESEAATGGGAHDQQADETRAAAAAAIAEANSLKQKLSAVQRELDQTKGARDRWRKECEEAQVAAEDTQKRHQQALDRIKDLEGQACRKQVIAFALFCVCVCVGGCLCLCVCVSVCVSACVWTALSTSLLCFHLETQKEGEHLLCFSYSPRLPSPALACPLLKIHAVAC